MDYCYPKKNTTQKGFTLAEILVTLSVLGILASAAFPLYEGISSRTAAATLIASMKHFGKECSINTLTNDASPLKLPDTIILSSSSGNQCSSGATLKNTTPFNGTLITGLRCVLDTQIASNEVYCKLTISPNGSINGSWESS